MNAPDRLQERRLEEPARGAAEGLLCKCKRRYRQENSSSEPTLQVTATGLVQRAHSEPTYGSAWMRWAKDTNASSSEPVLPVACLQVTSRAQEHQEPSHDVQNVQNANELNQSLKDHGDVDDRPAGPGIVESWPGSIQRIVSMSDTSRLAPEMP